MALKRESPEAETPANKQIEASNRPKARRTGPAVPASIAFSASKIKPCRSGGASPPLAMPAEQVPQQLLLRLQQQQQEQQSPPLFVLTSSSSGSSGKLQPDASLRAAPGQLGAADASSHLRPLLQPDARTPSPDARSGSDQQQWSRLYSAGSSPLSPAIAAVLAAQQQAQQQVQQQGGAPHAPAAAAPRDSPPQTARKAVRFAPGPLLPPAFQPSEGAPAPRRAVGSDGHPEGEGQLALPVRQVPFPQTDLNRSNIVVLEQLLGPENAPSVGRLKRRIGILPPNRPPRVHLTVALPRAQRQQA